MSDPVRVTHSGNEPTVSDVRASVPNADTLPDGQHVDHWILSDTERAKGFVRPVRCSYRHTVCGVVTNMSRKIAETYAAKPDFHGQTFCCGCCKYLPVGEHGDFVWDGTTEKVGT